MNYRIRNKWIISAAAIMVQLAIGALYAWSLFNKPLMEAFGVEEKVVVLTYSISLISFSLTTILSGRVHLKIGPRFTTLIGAGLYTGGILLSSFASSPFILYLTYGVMAGSGVGFVYVCPLSTLVKWFPNKKGMVTGVATAAFALGGFTFKQIIYSLLDIGGAEYTTEIISGVFLTLAGIYGVMTVVGALLLDVPETPLPISKNCKPQNWDHTVGQMLKQPNFYKLLASDLLALMPGLLVIGLATGIGEDYIGLSEGLAAGIVTIVALTNAAGRLLSGTISDKVGALRVYRFMYFLTILALALLAFGPVIGNYSLFLVAILAIAVGYGSFLSLVPTIVGRLFGGKYFSANYGLMFQAYGIAAFIGPFIKANSPNYQTTFMIAMGTAIAGLIFAFLVKDIDENNIEMNCEV